MSHERHGRGKGRALLLWGTLISLASIADSVAKDLPEEKMLPDATGLMVLSVVEGSQAETLGIRKGDILVSCNGVATQRLDELMAGIGKAQKEKTETLPLVLVREGQEIELQVKPDRLGVQLAPVTKGVPLETRPPSTSPRLDFSRLKEGPQEDWFWFSLEGNVFITRQ